MLISLSVHLLLLMFELLVADNLGANRHLWILVNQSINPKHFLFHYFPYFIAGLWIRIDLMRDPDPAFFLIAHPDSDPVLNPGF
jgi:hypothetical protein